MPLASAEDERKLSDAAPPIKVKALPSANARASESDFTNELLTTLLVPLPASIPTLDAVVEPDAAWFAPPKIVVDALPIRVTARAVISTLPVFEIVSFPSPVAIPAASAVEVKDEFVADAPASVKLEFVSVAAQLPVGSS
jgi:hypothetical protein